MVASNADVRDGCKSFARVHRVCVAIHWARHLRLNTGNKKALVIKEIKYFNHQQSYSRSVC